MSAESRLLKGHDPEDVVKLFPITIEECKAILANANKPVKKKAAKKKVAKTNS